MRSILLLSVLVPLVAARAQTSAIAGREPWNKPDAILILDPYAANEYVASTVAADPKIKAIIHQASQGMATDQKFLDRAIAAKKAHLRFGAYHLGLMGNPIAQADLFIERVRVSGATFVALDIEGIGGRNMSLKDAEIFARRVQDKLGRYPALYANFNVASTIAKTYGEDSAFAKMPLWIARFVKALPPLPVNRVWADYAIWQFGSELNCPEEIRKRRVDSLCEPYRPYVVKDLRYDMDVNVLNGGEERLTALFGERP